MRESVVMTLAGLPGMVTVACAQRAEIVDTVGGDPPSIRLSWTRAVIGRLALGAVIR